MNILESVISGVIQGLTEFLPISSSGHLVILHTFFGYREPKLLEDILLHCGTLLAVIIFFWKDIIGLFRDRRLLFLIIVGTIPAGLVGFFFGKDIELLFANTKVIGIALIVTALWLMAAHLFSRTTPRLRSGQANDERPSYAKASEGKRTTNLSIWHSLLIGISQAIALVPGISRSGATISTGLLLKRDRGAVFRFSFLLSVPAVIGALIFKMGTFVQAELAELAIMIWGSITACIIGIIALWFLKTALFKKKLHYFSIYCCTVGLIILFM